MTAIRLVDVTCLQGGRPALDAVSGVFETGSLTAVVGPNGAGKTTLLRAIAGLHRPSHGRIEVAGPVALLPQAATLDRSFPVDCRDVVGLGGWRIIGPFRRSGPAMDAAVDAALARVGLAGMGRRLIGDLSAGQFQRVLFARLIVQDAPVLLLDEPFTALDEATVAALSGLIEAWHAEGRTVVLVTHDLALARTMPSALLLAGRVIGWGTACDVLAGTTLLRARPEPWPAAA